MRVCALTQGCKTERNRGEVDQGRAFSNPCRIAEGHGTREPSLSDPKRNKTRSRPLYPSKQPFLGHAQYTARPERTPPPDTRSCRRLQCSGGAIREISNQPLRSLRTARIKTLLPVRWQISPCHSGKVGLRFPHDKWKGLAIWGMSDTGPPRREVRSVLLNGNLLSATNVGLAGRHGTD